MLSELAEWEGLVSEMYSVGKLKESYIVAEQGGGTVMASKIVELFHDFKFKNTVYTEKLPITEKLFLRLLTRVQQFQQDVLYVEKWQTITYSDDGQWHFAQGAIRFLKAILLKGFCRRVWWCRITRNSKGMLNIVVVDI